MCQVVIGGHKPTVFCHCRIEGALLGLSAVNKKKKLNHVVIF
jgi:hypothetical protein